MLKNAFYLAKIGADTAENEQHFAEILPIGRRVADRPGPRRSPPAPAGIGSQPFRLGEPVYVRSENDESAGAG